MALNQWRGIGGIISRGILAEIAPVIAAGALLEFFDNWRIDLKVIESHVEHNTSLWVDMEPVHLYRLQSVYKRFGNLEFITPEWVISSISKKYPGIASYMMTEPATSWLKKQVEELKRIAMEP